MSTFVKGFFEHFSADQFFMVVDLDEISDRAATIKNSPLWQTVPGQNNRVRRLCRAPGTTRHHLHGEAFEFAIDPEKPGRVIDCDWRIGLRFQGDGGAWNVIS
jgi:hypothetical protein